MRSLSLALSSCCCLLALASVAAAPAAAQDFAQSVAPVPGTPEAGTAFVLEVDAVCCSSGLLSLESSVTVEDGVIRVDTVRECGPLAAVLEYEYSVAVPPLPAGDYAVEVYTRSDGGGCGGSEVEPDITGALTVETRGALAGVRCTPGVEPAATLLFPYFEVALGDDGDPDGAPEGITTLLAITNSAAEPVLANVVLWSDLALPVGSFRIYLTGYDVQTLNLRDVLAGRLPVTGPAAFDVATPIPAAPEGCDAQDLTGPFDAAFATDALAGLGIDGDCWSSAGHPGRAVGYVTVDVVRSCSDLLPGDPGYFGVDGESGTGVTANDNVLLGDFILAETGESFAQGSPAVHLVADATILGPGDPTFYGAYVDGGLDARMPLGRLHGVRYVENEGFDGGTEILLWKDARQPATGPVVCDEVRFGVSWLEPLAMLDVFDEEENRVAGPLGAFRWATQRVPASALSPFEAGWMRIDLRDQGAAVSVLRALGRFSVGTGSGQLDDACAGVD